MREVNFLAERQKKISKQEVQDRRWLRIGAIVLGVVFTIFLISLGIYFYFLTQLNSVKAQEKAARDQIGAQQTTEGTLVIFIQKVKTLAQIYHNREEKNAALAYFGSIFKQGVLIKGLEFDAKDRVLILRIGSYDVFTLRTVFSTIYSPEVRQKYPAITPNSLGRDNAGQYEMQIAVSLNPTSPGASSAAQVATGSAAPAGAAAATGNTAPGGAP